LDLVHTKLGLLKENVTFDIVSYSEGAIQATALTYFLKQYGYDIRQYVTISGAGITNFPILNSVKTKKQSTYYELEKLISPLPEGDDKDELGKHNVSGWAKRLVYTMFGLSKKLNFDPVPLKRVIQIELKSKYYELLAKEKIPMVFFCAKKDMFFNFDNVVSEIEELKTYNPKIIVVAADGQHWFAHYHPTMITWGLEKAKTYQQ